MVGDDAHGDVYLFILAIFETAQFADLADDGLEYVGVVVGVFALHHAHQAFETHTSVDNLCREWFERAIRLAVVLHEHEVPYFNHFGIVLVH